jgi:putative ABC transport system permease protein
VVPGSRPVAQLFGGFAAAALGQQVRIGTQIFEGIGVLQENGQADDLAVMPITTVRTYLVGGGTDDRVDQIVVQATGQEAVSRRCRRSRASYSRATGSTTPTGRTSRSG